MFTKENLFTKENMTLIISLLGLILSISNTTYLFIVNRKNLKVTFKNYVDCSRTDKSMFFNLIIENRSRTKISISRMFLIIDELKVEFDAYPAPVFWRTEKTGERIDSSITIYSQTIPKDIDGLCSVGGLFEIENFPFKEFYNSKSLMLEIYTSRGLITKKLSIPENNN